MIDCRRSWGPKHAGSQDDTEFMGWVFHHRAERVGGVVYAAWHG